MTMQQVKVTLTYVAEVDDEVTIDMIHERTEDYIDQELPLNIYDELGEDSWLVRLKLQQWQTNIRERELVTNQKT